MATNVKFNTLFDHRIDPGIKIDPSEDVARQEFADECDIHNILRKFRVTGVLVDPTIGNLRRPMFEDFSHLPSLEQFQELKKSMVESYDLLPKEVKDRFGDPLIAANFFGRASNAQILQLWRDCGLSPVKPLEQPGAKPAEKPAKAAETPKNAVIEGKSE